MFQVEIKGCLFPIELIPFISKEISQSINATEYINPSLYKSTKISFKSHSAHKLLVRHILHTVHMQMYFYYKHWIHLELI